MKDPFSNWIFIINFMPRKAFTTRSLPNIFGIFTSFVSLSEINISWFFLFQRFFLWNMITANGVKNFIELILQNLLLMFTHFHKTCLQNIYSWRKKVFATFCLITVVTRCWRLLTVSSKARLFLMHDLFVQQFF